MDDVIKKLENIEKLLEKLLEKLIDNTVPQLPFIPQRLEVPQCPHPRMVPSHLVITGPMTFTCPDCGEMVTIYPNITF